LKKRKREKKIEITPLKLHGTSWRIIQIIWAHCTNYQSATISSFKYVHLCDD
jgi:hypothetical protein